MSLLGKLEADVEIIADATTFHNAFGCRPDRTTQASPNTVRACDLHDGQWGTAGSVINWNYVHDGKTKTAKSKLEAVDDTNKSATFSLVEGDIMEGYKSFIVIVQATPMADGQGSLVHWTFQYEKLNQDVPNPDSFMEFAINLTKDIDAHLANQSST